jgi:hypothetical protein
MTDFPTRTLPTAPTRIVLLAVFAILTIAILWAMGKASLTDSFGRIIADPWGIVTLIDLYAGFLVMMIVVVLAEPKRQIMLLVIMLTPFLGNAVTLLWLAFRLPLLATRFLVVRLES